jgi:LysM repeat protein
MKAYRFLIIVFVFSALTAVKAQQVELPLIEQYNQEWDKAALADSLAALDVQSWQNDIAKSQQSFKSLGDVNCDDQLMKLVNATPMDLAYFQKSLDDVESKIKANVRSKRDRAAEVNKLMTNPISALPQFFNRVQIELPKLLAGMSEDVIIKDPNTGQEIIVDVAKNKDYVVKKGDCLWYIARNIDFYGNGFAWPKIWEANKSVIGKNPNLIYPKQKYSIPPLTEDEKAKFDKLRHGYKSAPAK